MKVRIIKDYKKYREGQIVDVDPKLVQKLVDKGIARIDRMITESETHG